MAGNAARCPKCGGITKLPITAAQMVAPSAHAVQAETKLCEYCGEEIKVAAIVCRFCGMNLTTGVSTRAGESRPVSKAEVSHSRPEKTLWSGSPSHVYYMDVYIGGIIITIVGAGIGISLRSVGSGGAGIVFFLWFFGMGGFFLLYGVLARESRVYSITSRRVKAKWGIFSKRTSEVLLSDIRNITLDMGIIERLFGLGTIGVASAGHAGIEVMIEGVPQAESVKKLLGSAADDARS